MKRIFKHKVWLFIVFISVQLSNNNYSQDLINTYKNYLPEKYVDNPVLRKQLLLLLETKSHIHPDLMYYYITYYNMLSDNSTENRKARSNEFKQYINVIESRLLTKRNLWAERQIAILDTMQIEDAVKNRLIDKFRQVFLTLTADSLTANPFFEIDENQMNYYAVLFFNPESSSEYSPNTNYLEIREKSEFSAKEAIIRLHNAPKGSRSKPAAEEISRIIDSWYLLDSSFIKSGYNLTAPQPAEMIVNVIMRELSTDHQERFSFGLGYSPYNLAFNVKTSLFINGYRRTFDFETKKPMQQIALALGYKYYLREALGLFSYINAQLMYYYSFSSEPETASPGFSSDNTQGTIQYKEYLVFNKSDITPLSGQSIILNLSTPVYLIFNGMNIEAGLIAGINQVKYKFDYNYTYRKTQTYTTGSMWDPKPVTYTVSAGSGKNAYEDRYQRFLFSPTIGINFNPLKHTTINIALSTENISAFLLYGF